MTVVLYGVLLALMLVFPLLGTYGVLVASSLDCVLEVQHSGAVFSINDVAIIGLAISVCLRFRWLFSLPKWFLYASAALVVFILLASLLAQDAAAVVAARGTVGKIIAGVATAAVIRARGNATGAMKALFIGVGISVLFGMYQEMIALREGLIAVASVIPGDSVFALGRGLSGLPIRVPGGMDHHAHLGVVAAVCFVAVFVKCRDNETGWNGYWRFATFGIGAMGVWITESRIAPVAIGSALVALWLPELRQRLSQLKAGALAIGVILLIGAVVVIVPLGGVGSRIQAATAAIGLGSQLLWGMGVGEFEQANLLGLNVHSTPMQILTDAGVVAMMAYLVVLAGIFRGLLSQEGRGGARLVLASMAAMCGAVLFAHPAMNSRVHWLLIGIAASVASRLRAELVPALRGTSNVRNVRAHGRRVFRQAPMDAAGIKKQGASGFRVRKGHGRG